MKNNNITNSVTDSIFHGQGIGKILEKDLMRKPVGIQNQGLGVQAHSGLSQAVNSDKSQQFGSQNNNSHFLSFPSSIPDCSVNQALSTLQLQSQQAEQ